MQLSDALYLHAIPGFLIFTIAETIFLAKEYKEHPIKKDALCSLSIGIGGSLSNSLSQGLIIVFYCFLYKNRLFTISASHWWAWLIFFIADDFSYYWFHRMSHQVRLLWASHAVHHSSQEYTLATAIRIPWTSNLTGNFLFWSWMPLIGIEPGIILLMKSISVLYQFWLHTATIKKMPRWFEAIFNTPSFHRVHHASNVEYLDKNHGGNLVIWDKIFGTAVKETIKPKFGLSTNINSFNPFVIAFHEWNKLRKDIKKAKKLKDYFNYIFNSPGWSNDNSTKTTRQLQHEITINKRKCSQFNNVKNLHHVPEYKSCTRCNTCIYSTHNN